MINIKTMAQQTVTTHGTKVQVSATKISGITGILIQADPTNTGNVKAGDSTVSPTRGHVLAAGQSVTFTGTELSGRTEFLDITQFYCDADADGQKFNVSYLQHSA